MKSDAKVIIKGVIYENTDGWPGDRENSRVMIYTVLSLIIIPVFLLHLEQCLERQSRCLGHSCETVVRVCVVDILYHTH